MKTNHASPDNKGQLWPMQTVVQTVNLILHKLGVSLLLLALSLSLMAPAVHGMTRRQSISRTTALDGIDKYVEDQMEELRIPGAALAVVQGDQIVHLKGFGSADPGGRAVTAQTPFIIGSTSKSFTALAVMQLVEQGKIDLDAPAQRYLPWFRVADAELSARITVRHLLNQTSGLSRSAGVAHLTSSDNSDRALEERVRALGTARLTVLAGTAFQYSNANYDVLGMIVQSVSGHSFESYVEANIFDPLDMRHSSTSYQEAKEQGMASGHRYWFGRPLAAELPYNRGELPSGYLISTAEDLGHYLTAYLNEGRYGGKTILSRAGIAELQRGAIASGVPDPFYAAYGMGWFAGELGGVPVVQHDGHVPNGFSAHLLLVPSQKVAVALLMNGNNGLEQTRFNAVGPSVLGRLLGVTPTVTANPLEQGVRIVFAVALVGDLLLVVGFILALRAFQRRRGLLATHGRRATALHVGPSLLLLAISWLFLLGLPLFFGTPLAGIILTAPDYGYLMLLGGIVASAWSALRLIQLFFALRLQKGLIGRQSSGDRPAFHKKGRSP